MIVLRTKVSEQPAHHHIDDNQSKRRQPHESKTHNSARVNRHIEGCRNVFLSRNRSSRIALGRYLHPDKAGSYRYRTTKEKSDGRVDALMNIRGMIIVDQNGDNSGEYHHEYRQDFVFLLQESHGSIGNSAVNEG